jgi:hypothetical protein
MPAGAPVSLPQARQRIVSLSGFLGTLSRPIRLNGPGSREPAVTPPRATHGLFQSKTEEVDHRQRACSVYPCGPTSCMLATSVNLSPPPALPLVPEFARTPSATGEPFTGWIQQAPGTVSGVRLAMRLSRPRAAHGASLKSGAPASTVLLRLRIQAACEQPQETSAR